MIQSLENGYTYLPNSSRVFVIGFRIYSNVIADYNELHKQIVYWLSSVKQNCGFAYCQKQLTSFRLCYFYATNRENT